MTDSLDAIRAELSEMRDVVAGTNARREQIPLEIEALREELGRLDGDNRLAANRIRALERAEAVLTEHASPAPEPVPAEEPLAPQEQLILSPTRQRIRADLDDARRARHGTTETPTAPVRPARASTDPMTVLPRQSGGGFSSPKSGWRTIADGGYADLDANNLSRVDAERADLVMMILDGGEASQIDIAETLRDLLSVDKPGTSSKLASLCLAILYKQGRAVPTGEKGLDRNEHRTSPIWKATDPS